MPKVTPFNIKDGYRHVLQKILEEQVKEKSKKINIYGVKITSYPTYSNTCFKQLTQEEYEDLIKNEDVLKLLEKHQEQQKKEKIKKYEEVRVKGDFVLFDYLVGSKPLHLLNTDEHDDLMHGFDIWSKNFKQTT